MGGERETLPNPPLTPVSGEESHLQSLAGIIFREGVRKPAPAKRCTLKGRLKMINMGKNRNEPHGHTSAEHRAVFTCKRSKIPYRTLGKHKTRRLGVQEQEQDAGRMFNCEFQENVLFNLCNFQSVSYLLRALCPTLFLVRVGNAGVTQVQAPMPVCLCMSPAHLPRTPPGSGNI